MLRKVWLVAKLFFYTVKTVVNSLSRPFSTALQKYRFRIPTENQFFSKTSSPGSEAVRERFIVIIGASFAGYHAARLIATSLPPGSPYRVLVIEPHSHIHFTWVLPRFCIVPGHEHKAFIPYGPYLADAPAGSYRWIQDRAVAVQRTCIQLRDSKEKVPYDFLLIATGSEAGPGLDGLPSRVRADRKADAMELLRGMQQRIADATRLVVVGGGAAGVELATDAKRVYPEKGVVLIHPRQAVMHRFGPELQAAALEGLNALGVEVILGERVVGGLDNGVVTLSSGRKVECDLSVNCAGQKPVSQLLAELSPTSITPSGHIRVKLTMQVMSDALPNIYACGDVAETGIRNPNSRAAMQQAVVAADNIVLAATGRKPKYRYKPHWAEAVIKLTLGLERSVTHFGDGKNELLFHGKETDPALMSDGAWKHWKAKPFEDPLDSTSTPDIEATFGADTK